MFSILPAIAYTLNINRRTGQFYGINKLFFLSALTIMVFSVFTVQSLTIVGITGLILLFNYTIYNIITIYEPSIYPKFIYWVEIWGAIFHWIIIFCNMCDYIQYMTDFLSKIFGFYIGTIYISQY